MKGHDTGRCEIAAHIFVRHSEMANFFDRLKDLGYECKYPTPANLSGNEVSSIICFCASFCSSDINTGDVTLSDSVDHALEVVLLSNLIQLS